MSDIYIPGVKSRFDTEKLVDGLMKIERLPKERAEKNVERLELEKSYWQEIGRRINTLRDSARLLFSFQNPFGERSALSGDESVLTAVATREAMQQDYRFTVKQTASADRFLSPPLDEKYRIEAGTYSFSVGEKEQISFNFKGGTMKEFADTLNRRGKEKIGASVITVNPGTRSLLIESKITGSENRLDFKDDAATMAISMGMVERTNDTRKTYSVNENSPQGGSASTVSVSDGVLEAKAGSSALVRLNLPVPAGSTLVLKLDTATTVKSDDEIAIPQPPPGPDVPSPGTATYGGISIENDPSAAPTPVWEPPEHPERYDTMDVLSLTFTDGTSAKLPAITDTANLFSRQYRLDDYANGKTIASLTLENTNTHRDIKLSNIEVFDPAATGGGFKPINAVSTAQDAIVAMEGIEMRRPSNIIDDIVPGVTVTLRGTSDRPVNLNVVPDREAVKDALISLVGNYNRLMTELNVLTRNDDKILDEISYLSPDEKAELKKRQGAFAGDSTLTQFRSRLQQTVSAPYPTDEGRDLALLAQIGIGTNMQNNASYDPARLRGYLEINEKALDLVLETKMPAIRQLFGSDTSGDLLIDTGVAYNLDAITKPFVETGGLVSLKTGTLDSRVAQDKRRIESMERQLALKEADLNTQYGKMEGAYRHMEQMMTSFNNFNKQNGGN